MKVESTLVQPPSLASQLEGKPLTANKQRLEELKEANEKDVDNEHKVDIVV